MTSSAVATGSSRIFACDSEIRTSASSWRTCGRRKRRRRSQRARVDSGALQTAKAPHAAAAARFWGPGGHGCVCCVCAHRDRHRARRLALLLALRVGARKALAHLDVVVVEPLGRLQGSGEGCGEGCGRGAGGGGHASVERRGEHVLRAKAMYRLSVRTYPHVMLHIIMHIMYNTMYRLSVRTSSSSSLTSRSTAAPPCTCRLMMCLASLPSNSASCLS